MLMWFNKCVFIGFALSVCATSVFSAQWFLGEFRGIAKEADSELQMSVSCSSGEPCVVLAKPQGGKPVPVEIPIKAPPNPLDATIPNNNWEVTRDAAASKPEWYEHKSFGPILRPLRPLLKSTARLENCIDLDGTAYLALCSLSTDPESKRSAVLLLNTMNGSCGSIPFCAYYFLPLERVRGL